MHVLHHHPFTAILPRTRSFMQVAHAEERRLQFKFEVEDLTRKKAELVHDLDVKRAQVMAVLQPRIDQLTAQMEDIRYAVAFTLFFSFKRICIVSLEGHPLESQQFFLLLHVCLAYILIAMRGFRCHLVCLCTPLPWLFPLAIVHARTTG